MMSTLNVSSYGRHYESRTSFKFLNGWHASFAGKAELKELIRKSSSRPYVEFLSDFHLLLWLAAQPQFDLTAEIAEFAEFVKEKTEVPEGYKYIIQAIADA